MKNNNNSLTPPQTVDVLIAGNGPVGATLAALLGRYGVQTLVVDRTHEILQMPRAIALDNEALRILQLAGLTEDAFEKIVIPEVRFRSPLYGQFGRANTSGTLDGHPKLVTFYQPEMEQSVRDQYQHADSVTSLGGLELMNLEQDGDGVLVTLRDETGLEHRVRTQYLVGADGASSRVRGLIGQDFEGHSCAEDWLIVDATDRHDRAIDHVEFICDHRRPTPHMPAPGGRERWEFMLQAGESREQMETDKSISALLEQWIPSHELNIERKAVYRFHARCCKRFQNGRVFLVGDAAHITPPFVGQGLVSGLRDAANLAWKLAWVLRGHASSSILNSYDEERRPHAQKMINLAKFVGHLVMPNNALLALLNHGLMRLSLIVPPLRRYFEELDIKPKNIFRSGLFVSRGGGRRLRRGGLFPQGLVRGADGVIQFSDTALGDGLTLVGFGVDPRTQLENDTQRRWEAHGGGYLQIGLHGQSGHTPTPFVEDMTTALLALAPTGWLAVVRPDRLIMHDGSIERATRIVDDSLHLLTQ